MIDLCKHGGGRLVGQTCTVYSPQIYTAGNVMVAVNITYEHGEKKNVAKKKNLEKIEIA